MAKKISATCRKTSSGLAYARAPSVPWQLFYWLGLAVLLWGIKGAHLLDADEGIVLEGAWALLNGRTLYVDSFQIVPPGAFYVVYWLWKLFGPHYALAQLLGIGSVLLTAFAIFRTSRLLADESLFVYAGPLFYCLASAKWPAINHNTFNALALAWAAYFCVRAIKTASTKDAAVGGFLTGISVLFLHHKGLVFLIAAAAFYGFHSFGSKSGPSRNQLFYYVLCSIAPLFLLLNWPVSVLFEQLVHLPMTRYVEMNRISYLPLFIAIVCVGLAARSRWKSSKEVQFLLLIQLALLATAFQRSDLSHVLVVSFPCCVLFPIAIPACRRSPTCARATRAAYYGAGALLMLLGVSWATMWALESRWHAYYHARLIEYVRQHCDSLYAGPFLPGLYYEARKINPTSYYALFTGFNTTAQFAAARAQLEAARPDCVVAVYVTVAKFNYSRANPVDEFIKQDYAAVDFDKNYVFEVYRRK
jgi:hypothetical protein